jgi:cytochrome c5
MHTSKIKNRISAALIICVYLLLTACSEGNSIDSTKISWPPITLSSEEQRLYQTSCQNCHGIQGTGAPFVGDTQAWNAILAKGFENTLNNSINGFGGMPPNGQCFECNPDQMSQLLRYMSNPAN